MLEHEADVGLVAITAAAFALDARTRELAGLVASTW
jgi:hypothetical protein